MLEDLHWSDYATLEWLAFLARRQERAKLLVISTYRPEEVPEGEHPLKRIVPELQLHGHCAELRLESLTEEAVGEYLERRFTASPLPTDLAKSIYQRTDGNPLFMVNVVDYIVKQGFVVEKDRKWEMGGS